MIRKLLVVALVLALIGNVHQGVARDKSATLDKGTSVDAVASAFDALNRARIEHTDKRIVLSAHGKFIVVSFLNIDNSAYGGQAHVVYDPTQKKVVRVVGEQ